MLLLVNWRTFIYRLQFTDLQISNYRLQFTDFLKCIYYIHSLITFKTSQTNGSHLWSSILPTLYLKSHSFPHCNSQHINHAEVSLITATQSLCSHCREDISRMSNTLKIQGDKTEVETAVNSDRLFIINASNSGTAQEKLRSSKIQTVKSIIQGEIKCPHLASQK